MVGSGSTTSQGWGCSCACVCMQPPWEIPQAPDGNNLYQMKGENKELPCLVENWSQSNLVRNYLASRTYIFCFLFLWGWLRGFGGEVCDLCSCFHTIRNMGMENSISIPCSVATELLIFCDVGERKSVCVMCVHTHSCVDPCDRWAWKNCLHFNISNRPGTVGREAEFQAEIIMETDCVPFWHTNGYPGTASSWNKSL